MLASPNWASVVSREHSGSKARIHSRLNGNRRLNRSAMAAMDSDSGELPHARRQTASCRSFSDSMTANVRNFSGYLRIIPEPVRVNGADWRESRLIQRLKSFQNKVFCDVA